MKASKCYRIISGSFVTLIFCLFIPETVFCQTEKLGIVSYTAPKGWTKDAEENMVTFSEDNETTGKFCVIVLHGAIASTGDPNKDFDSVWSGVAKEFKTAASPRRLTPVSGEGWTRIAGGSKIKYKARDTTIILTIFSGFGKTVSVLVITDDKSYRTQGEAFIESIFIESVGLDTPTKFGSMISTLARSSPEAVIKAFYNGYIRSTGKGVDPFGKRSTLKKHLTARLIKEQVMAHEASQDEDYFLCSKQYFPEWEDNFNISKPLVKGAAANAIVTFPGGSHRVKVSLKKEARVWKIDRAQDAR